MSEKIKEQLLCCESEFVHKDVVESISKKMPSIDTLYDLAELYKIFGDSTRIRILYALFENEICVCDISELLNISVSAISHQLRILKNANLVKNRRIGRVCLYSLADSHVKTIIKQGINHILEG